MSYYPPPGGGGPPMYGNPNAGPSGYPGNPSSGPPGYPGASGPPGYPGVSSGPPAYPGNAGAGGPPGAGYGGMPATGGIYPGPPGGGGYPSYPPGGNMQPGFGAPMGGPPTTMRPPGSGPPSGGGGYPAIGPPGSGLSGAAPSALQPPKSSVMFFSTSGGVAVPTTMTPPPSNFPDSTLAPPGSVQLGMPPPPATLGASAPFGSVPALSGPPSGGYAAPTAFMNPGMPSAFGSAPNLAGPIMAAPVNTSTMSGMVQAPDAQAASAGAPLPLIDEMDLSIQCNPSFLRATVSKIVGNQGSATNSKIPLGLVCKPMAGDVGTSNDEIDVVDFGTTGIVRCKRCRTYINPFVTWADNGRRWRCNICGMLNDVPSTYFSHLDNNGQRRDKEQRPELSRCSVEFVAPGDYMVRPPQPPVYFFVIDVSEASVSSGVIQSCVNAIKASLDNMPGDSRTQIGFITYDSHIHFYNLKSTLAAPQMLVVSDVSDVIMPLPEDLLVNLHESRSVVDALLDALPSMFKTTTTVNTCTGPALLAAKRVIQHLGGKLCLFQSSLPNVGEGSLKIRENPRLLGTDKEHTLLNAEDPWYKTNAIDFSRLQISVDTFLFSGQYTDLATLAVLSKYTAGSTYYYPAFVAARDGAKFEYDLHHDLTRATAFEAVMRVRATRGLRFSNYYGNYFVRGTDLLALPNCTSDSSFSMDIAYDEAQLSAQAITIQAALLYTSANGERRIRVHTMVLPVTNSVPEMVDSLDIDCAMNIISKQATDIALKTGFDNARQRVHQTTVEIMRATRGGGASVGPTMNQYGMMPGQAYQQQQASASAPLPNSLLLLPLYSMSLQKSLVLRGGADVRIDERAFFQQLLYNMDVDESKVFIYPRMFSLHTMIDEHGMPIENPEDESPSAGSYRIKLPEILNLSYERLTSDGIFLLENGYDLFIWIGRAVNPSILNSLVGCHSLEGVDMSIVRIQPDLSDYANRVNAVIEALREDRARYMQVHFIREGDGYAEAYFARFLIEDRANFAGGNLSYMEYHAHITRAISGLPG